MSQTQETTIREEISQAQEFLGEAVFTNLPSNRNIKNKHSEVLSALRAQGLDEKVARQFLPAQAFNRALQKLQKGRVIDVLREDKDDILFQFSTKYVEEDTEEGGNQFEYRKEVKVLLEKQTGKIFCKDDRVRVDAQNLLDQCLEDRTTSDITNIVNKLLQNQVDTVPLASGAYFVRKDQAHYVDKVQSFLKDLKRNLSRLSIPKGADANTDRTVAESVVGYVEDLLEKLQKRTKEITLGTRPATTMALAQERNAIRAKVEAFASILGDKVTELLERADQDDDELRETLQKVAEERKLAPPTSKGTANLFGHSLTRVMHYLGKNNWTFEKAKKAVSNLTDVSGVKESSLRTFWSDGRNEKYSKPADLTADQVAELEAASLIASPSSSSSTTLESPVSDNGVGHQEVKVEEVSVSEETPDGELVTSSTDVESNN